MITIVGVCPSPVPDALLARIERATLVVGAPRHLARVNARRTFHLSGDFGAALDAIASCEGEVVVLASGDPGFFGIVRALAERFGRARIEVHTGVSSVAAAFARAAMPWDDALVVSVHGRDARAALNACRAHPKVAVLTAPDVGPAELAAELAGLDRRFLVAEHLGEENERIFEGSATEVAAQSWADPNVVIVYDEDAAVGAKSVQWPPRRATERWGLPEDAFEHRNGMITKSEVRAVALARLGPGLGDLVWDVGAGSGSVAIECARMGAAVIAVERYADACAIIERNARQYDVNLQIVCNEVPDALDALPDPDAVFVGGGGAEFGRTLKLVGARARRAVVVALAAVERVGSAVELLASGGLEVDAVLVHAARLRSIGDVHRLAPVNPVFLVSGMRQ